MQQVFILYYCKEKLIIVQAALSNKETKFYQYMTWLYSILDAHSCITNE
jgi:hypothetical protein